MLVNLARKWFAPNGALYSPKDNPNSFLDTWEEHLPKGAQVVDKDGKVLREIEWTEEEKKALKDEGKAVVRQPPKVPEGQPTLTDKEQNEKDLNDAKDTADVKSNAEIKVVNTGSTPVEKLTPAQEEAKKKLEADEAKKKDEK